MDHTGTRLPKYRPDIDGMRAIAVLSVVVYHAFPRLVSGGFVGVDVFFVISGFLIGTILFENLEAGTFTFRDFYYRRIKRIFPALFTVLVAVLIGGWLFLLPDQLVQLGRHVISGVFFISNFTLWKELGYFDGAAELKPLLHLWSLAVEEQFYIFWPLFLFFAWKKSRTKLFRIIVGIFFISLIINIRATAIHSTTRFYLPLERFWEILAGSLLAYSNLFKKDGLALLGLSRWFGPEMRSALGLSAIAFAVIFLSPARDFPGWWALLPVSGAVLIISAGPTAWLNRKLLASRPLVIVGLISYPLYLWHWPLLSFATVIAFGPVAASIRFLLVAVSILMAFATYYGIEKPLRTLDFRFDSLKVRALCASMLLAAFVGLTLLEGEGFPTRYPSEIRAFTKLGGINSFPFRPVELYKKNCESIGVESICTEDIKPSIFFWGDSHADALFPGLNVLQQQHRFGLSRATGCGNPPFLHEVNYTDSWCDSASVRLKANLLAMTTIEKTQPALIILHARWANADYHKTKQETMSELQFTVAQIKKVSPRSRVVILGPVPNWKDSLLHSMLNYRVKGALHVVPPVYMSFGLEPEIQEWDSYMESRAKDLGLEYISTYRVLCKSDGCLTRVGNDPADLTARDYGHLSPAGAIYLLQKIDPNLIPAGF
jgi:peptidoglycan/LPS O-acetylase OafA/YrhL